MINENTPQQLLEDLENYRNDLNSILRKQAPGDIQLIREAILSIKRELRRIPGYEKTVEDMYGDLPGEGEE